MTVRTPTRHARRWLRLTVMAAAIALPGGTLPLLGTTTVHANTAAHVMVVVMENEGYSSIIGNSSAPYLNGLASSYESATKWYGLSDTSLYDYNALISGTTKSYSSPTIVDEMANQGTSWKAYFEGMPKACYTGGSSGSYTKTHNPFVHFTSITGNSTQCNRVVPYVKSSFDSDLNSGSPPDFVYLVPNNCDDMHDTCGGDPIAHGDSWLSSNLGPVFSSSWYANGGIVIITWDSGPTSDHSHWNTGNGGHIATIVVSAGTHSPFSSGGNHYGTCRAIEQLYGIGFLGASSTAANGDLAL